MARPSRGAPAPKRKKQDGFFAEDNEAVEFFDDGTEKTVEESEASEQSSDEEETAEQKRLRLAKEYLSNVRAVEAAARGGDEESEEEQGDDSLDEAVARRLKQDAAEARGVGYRRLAARVVIPSDWEDSLGQSLPGARLRRGHALSVTSIALTADDRTLFSVSKDGSLLRHDTESGARERLASHGESGPSRTHGGGAPWLKPSARQASRDALLACAVSSDGLYVAAGGGSKRVMVWDTRVGGAPIKSFPGHKDAVTALAFRQGTHELFSGSLDRSIKIWSLDDMAYLDTLFGHQAEVLGMDVLRTERVVSAGADRTCRVWKVPEESQLIFRGSYPVIECCAYSRGGEWVSGDASGSLSLWNATRKKPVYTVANAHGSPKQDISQQAADILSVAVCPYSDLVASGAGDGFIRLWSLDQGQRGTGARSLSLIGGMPARGFVNSLAVARSARFVAAAMGQEPRLGRWERQGHARNGVLILPISLREEDEEEEEEEEESDEE